MDDQDDGVSTVGINVGEGCADGRHGFADRGFGVIACNINGSVVVLDDKCMLTDNTDISVRVQVGHYFVGWGCLHCSNTDD
jgi:hypothetical protein